MPVGGPNPTEGDVSLQGITDMKATIVALGGEIDPSVPNRAIATSAMIGSTTMSQQRLAAQPPGSLLSVKNGLTTGVQTLSRARVSRSTTRGCARPTASRPARPASATSPRR